MPSVVKPEECVFTTTAKSVNAVPPLLSMITPAQKPKVVEAIEQTVPLQNESVPTETKERTDDGRHSEYIKLVGLPFDCGMRAVKDFVQPFAMHATGRNIFLMKDKRGRDSCKAMVRMASEEEARRASAGLHKKYMGWRYIEAYHVGEKECGWYSLPLSKYETDNNNHTEKRDHRYRGNTNYQHQPTPPVTFGHNAPVAFSYYHPWYMCNPMYMNQYPMMQQPYCDYTNCNGVPNVSNIEAKDGQSPSLSPVPSMSDFTFETVPSMQSLDDVVPTDNATDTSNSDSMSIAEADTKSNTSSKRSGMFVHNPYSLPAL